MSKPRAIVSIQTTLEGFDVEWRAMLQDVVVVMGGAIVLKARGTAGMRNAGHCINTNDPTVMEPEPQKIMMSRMLMAWVDDQSDHCIKYKRS